VAGWLGGWVNGRVGWWVGRAEALMSVVPCHCGPNARIFSPLVAHAVALTFAPFPALCSALCSVTDPLCAGGAWAHTCHLAAAARRQQSGASAAARELAQHGSAWHVLLWQCAGLRHVFRPCRNAIAQWPGSPASSGLVLIQSNLPLACLSLYCAPCPLPVAFAPTRAVPS